MEDALPDKFDVIILGTGLGEAILAAACARSGLSVLHLDRNDYYGAEWASFNLECIGDWAKSESAPFELKDPADFKRFLEADEHVVMLDDHRIVNGIDLKWLPASEEKVSSESETSIREHLQKVGRRFSIDLLPKVILAKGDMVQVLCDSEVSRYAEFKLVERQICPVAEDDGKISLNIVPCSKGEIFTSQIISTMEKRLLMKFITFCTNWKTMSKDASECINEYADKPFEDFLTSLGLTPKLQLFVINAIGILEAKPTTVKGLEAVCRFMDSVGHFGASPFLYPIYGNGEMAQFFCRLSAVYCSTYCLGRSVDAYIVKNDKIVAVIARDQRVNCEYVVSSHRHVPDLSELSTQTKTIQRHVFITKTPICKGEKEQMTLINLVPLMNNAVSRIMEGGGDCCVAPKGYYLVHATATDSKNGEEDVEPTIERIFQQQEVEPLWHLKFSLESRETCSRSSRFTNLTVAPSLDIDLDYSSIIKKCRNIFCETWPDRDFLPRKMRPTEEEEEKEDEKVPANP